MMQVYLDGKRLENAGSTLASALQCASDAAGERLLIEAEADGRRVESNELQDPPPTDPFASEIRFKSTERSALIRETLLEARDLLDDIRDAQQQAVGALQTGRIPDAMGILGGLLQNWQCISRTVQLTIGVESVTPEEAEGLAIAPATGDLASRLGDVRTALMAQDFVALADLLAYDLEEEADRWKRLIERLTALVEDTGRSA